METLDRHRSVFKKSLRDGVGKPDAGADFFMSAVSAERKGYLLNKDDNGLIKMFYSVIRKVDEDNQISGPSSSYDLNTEGEETMRGEGTSEASMGYAMSHGAGMNLADTPSYDEKRVVPPEPGQSLAGRGFHMVDGHEDDQYRTHNYLGSDMNPLHDNYHNMVGDFYVHPDDHKAESQSQKDGHKETKWEDHIRDDPAEFLQQPGHYGKLDTNHATNHALYQQDYNTWATDNSELVDRTRLNLEEQGADESQIQHALKKLHIDEKKAEWKDNLGFMDYLFGMEWLTPEERDNAYKHMQKNGVASGEQFRTNRHLNNPNFIPRFIRNFQQRFSGMYDQWTRDPDRPGHGIRIQPINLSEAAEHITPSANLQTMQEHQTPGKNNSWERAVDHLNLMMGDHAIVNNERPKQMKYSDTPLIHGKQRGEPTSMGHIMINPQHEVIQASRAQAEVQVKKRFPGYDALKLMLGVDDDHQVYPKGAHPTWGTLWNPHFKQEEVDEIFRKRGDDAKRTANAGRMARTHSPIHYGEAMDDSQYDYLDDHETASTYWRAPWNKGGLAKHPNELFNLLHHHTLLYDEKKKAKERTYDEAGQLVESKNDPRLEMSEDYARLIAEAEGEQVEDVDEKEKEYEKSHEGVRSHSLLFSRTNTGIEGRHGYGVSGDVQDYGMLPLIAPFGQKENQLYSMMGAGGKSIRTNIKGDPEDAQTNLNPHNISMSSSIAGTGGGNAQYARHAATVDSAFNNIVHDDYHTARKTGDKRIYDKRHKALNGHKHLRVAHRFMALGGALSDERMMAHGAHSYHTIGSMLGMAHAPMDAPRDVLPLSDYRLKPTLANHEEDLAALRTQPHQFEQADLDNELEQIEQDYESQMANAEKLTDKELGEITNFQTLRENMSVDDKKQLIADEYERRMERAKEEHKLKVHAPSTFSQMKLPPHLNPSGSVSGVMNRQPLSEATPEYEQGVAELSVLEAEKERLESIGDKKGEQEIISRIADKNKELDDLESGLESTGKGGKRFAQPGHDSILEARLVADTNAISQGGKHLQTMLESDPALHNHIFNPELDHETIEANIRMWARMSNEYLNIVPHEQHGIHTRGSHQTTEEGHQGQVDIGTNAKHALSGHPNQANIQSMQDTDGFIESLGLDPKNEYHKKTALDYIENHMLPQLMQDPTHSPSAMTMEQYVQQQHPDLDIKKELESLKKDKRARNTDFLRLINGLYRNIGHNSAEERNSQLGIHHHLAYNSDPRRQRKEDKGGNVIHETKPSAGGSGMQNNENDYWNVMQKLNSILTDIPGVSPPQKVSQKTHGITSVPVNRFGPDSHSVHSIYDSVGYRHEFGDEFKPNFKYNISKDGNVNIIPVDPQNNKQRLIQPLEKFWNAMDLPESWMSKRFHPEHQGNRERLNRTDRMGPQFKPNSIGLTRNTDKHSVGKSHDNLAHLTNPDIIRKDLGPKVPVLQPMHRIFEIDDLKELRGFSGDWIVSHMPQGERGFVKKEDDDVTSSFTLSDEDKKNFKKVTDEDFHADVIKLEDGYYIFDVIEFAEKEVHSVVLSDRIKIVRGGMEGIENIHVPSASDTRLTDDEGLKAIVENLNQEYDELLLRDAKSVYMAGELRHPKWVLLKPGNDIILRVLERRGSNPYTYRLGTGPITRDERIGDRAVESQGETYMDVGVAFDSPEKFNEGDHVKVNASNVSEVESADGDSVFTLTASKIVEEAEGEGLVSRETLGMLAKSIDEQWLCEVQRAKSGIRVSMPQGDVLYKCTQSGQNWMVHSPLAKNSYVIRLAESQRPYWAPVAGALLKADLEIAEKEEVTENAGFSADNVEPAEPLVKPKKVKGTDWWKENEKKKVLVKGLQLIDKFLKSGVGSVGSTSTGAMGLGIGYATPIESPSGPTNLHDEKTMPDFDNKKRPGEDSDIEPGMDVEEPVKRRTIPTKEGVLEIDSDKAVFHT